MKDRLTELVRRYNLVVFLAMAIFLALLMVLASIVIYYRSGAYQLDLSRPEYKEVRSQIEKDKKTSDIFGAQGPVNEAVLDDFLVQYQTEADRALGASAFSNDVLSNDQLGI